MIENCRNVEMNFIKFLFHLNVLLNEKNLKSIFLSRLSASSNSNRESALSEVLLFKAGM